MCAVGSARFELEAKVAPWIDEKSKRGGSVAAVPCAVPYALLQAATQNFSSVNLLGEGSFGLVYKAKLAYDVNAAVKRLSGAGSKESQKEFQVLLVSLFSLSPCSTCACVVILQAEKKRTCMSYLKKSSERKLNV